MLSRISYALCTIIMLYASFVFYPKWKQPGGENIISWDAAGYYWYLPSVFIYKDLKHQGFADSIVKKYEPATNFYGGFKLPNGNFCMKYSSGMALMSLPFFTIANVIAKPLGYPADGFSPPYALSLQIGCVFIALLGIWFFRKLLLLFYSDNVVAVILLLLVFGTNYLNYSVIDAAMTHGVLFTVYVFLLLSTYYFYKTFSYKYAILIGLLVGLATLTRPTEVLSCMIPLLWGMESISIKSIKSRFGLLFEKWSKLLVAGICAAAIVSIQLFYWKYVSGHWLVYSYEDQGFSFRHPHFKDYTFSYETGWLMYTPMMLLAFIGIIPFIKNGKNKVAILVFFLLNYYIVSAWNIWWYGGRAMIQSYPVLFFPIASLVQVLLQKKVLLWIASPFLLLFMYFNLWVIYQYHGGGLIMPGDYVTNEFFWRVAGRWHVPKDLNKMRDSKDYFEGTPRDLKPEYTNDFESDSTIAAKQPIDGRVSLYLDKDHKKTKAYKFAIADKTKPWLRVQARFRCDEKEWDFWRMALMHVQFYNAHDTVKEAVIRPHRFLNEPTPRDIYMDVKVPKQPFDSVGVFFSEENSDKLLLIDDLQVWSFK